MIRRRSVQVSIASIFAVAFPLSTIGFNVAVGDEDVEAKIRSFTLLSPERYKLQFRTGNNGSFFAVCITTASRSRIKDLGEMKWQDVKEIPPLTPHRTLESARSEQAEAIPGHLYLAHIKDKDTDRYALFRVESLEPGDSCKIDWKWIPSPLPVEPPSLVSIEREKKDAVVSWKAAKGVKSYRIVRVGETDPVETAETRYTFENPPANAVVKIELKSVSPGGEESEPIPLEVHTHPEGWKSGTFELGAMGGDAYCLSQGKIAGREDVRAELFITNSAGGASSLTFTAPYGIGRSAGDEVFLQIPDPKEPLALAKRFHTDDRSPASRSFLVRTRDGGIAHVRIVGAEFPKVKFAYLYSPTFAEAPKPEGPPLSEAEAEAIRKIIRRMDSDSFDERQKANAELAKTGSRALPVVEKALKDKPTSEVEQRLKAWKEELARKDVELAEEINGAQ